MSVQAETLAAKRVADWLRWNLPAKVAEVNATRAAVLKASTPGPYTMAVSANALVLSKTSRSSGTSVTVTSGQQYTTAQLVTLINAQIASLASADSDDRLTLTGDAPSSSNSMVSVQSSAHNSAFGWDIGGVHVTNPPLVAPGWKGICDGWPLAPDFGSGLAVVIGKRQAKPVAPGPRRDEYLCALELAIFRPNASGEAHRTREAIGAAVQCVRETLMSDTGRTLGNTVMLVEEVSTTILGAPFKWTDSGGQQLGPIFDAATMNIAVRVFERPPSS